MVTDEKLDLKRPDLAAPIAELNQAVASLGIKQPMQDELANQTYGENVFGIRFNGIAELGRYVDAVSKAFWPQDLAAVDPASATDRDYLLVCANYPEADRTDALQFFTTFRPGTATWIYEEPSDTALREVANVAVNIDSSAKLRNHGHPPGYNDPASAYLMNLYWLTQTMEYPEAILEINKPMHDSLDKWGVELAPIEGAEPRDIGGKFYSRFIIDPTTVRNSGLVEIVKLAVPTTYNLTNSGAIKSDKANPVAA